MSNARTIIIDTDALLALVNINDALHHQAKTLLISLHQEGYSLLILPTTLSEFSLLATRYIGLPQTQSVIEVWTKGADHTLLEIDQVITQDALRRFSSQTSKQESLFDCYVMAASKKYNLTHIFSFDQGYKKKKNGFKLAADL